MDLKTKEVLKQKNHYKSAEDIRFFWQTTHPVIKKMEEKLLSSLASIIRENKPLKVLEIGCGEGANITTLSRTVSPSFVGIDFSLGKVKFASTQFKSATFKQMDATKLDFKNKSFDLVFLRDVIHHVPHKKKLFSEIFRVAKKRVVIVEANGKNPIMWLFGTFVSIEKDVKNSVVRYIVSYIKGVKPSGSVGVSYHEPSSIARFLLHYKFGFEKAYKLFFIRWFLKFVEKLALVVLPKSRWSYVVYDVKL